MWQSWCIIQFLVEWVYETFGSQVKEYLKEKQLPLKWFLVMDNATAHSQVLDDDLPDGFDFIKVEFLPPNMLPLTNPWTNESSLA